MFQFYSTNIYNKFRKKPFLKQIYKILITGGPCAGKTTALENIIEETENLINECYDYYAKEVALQTTNKDAAYYVSTNAQSNAEGPIENLVDGDENSHFHTEYTNDMGGAHYIQVAMGSGNELSSFRFKYATRKAQTDFPKTIEIYGKIRDFFWLFCLLIRGVQYKIFVVQTYGGEGF